MLDLAEAIEAIQGGTPIEVPYTTRKGCRGLMRRVETPDYWVTLSVSEKPGKARTSTAWWTRYLKEPIKHPPSGAKAQNRLPPR